MVLKSLRFFYDLITSWPYKYPGVSVKGFFLLLLFMFWGVFFKGFSNFHLSWEVKEAAFVAFNLTYQFGVFLSLFGFHYSEGFCLLLSLMMLFFNCFDFCDLSEIFFDGLCAFVEFCFPNVIFKSSLCCLSVFYVSACSFCLAHFLIYVHFSS